MTVHKFKLNPNTFTACGETPEWPLKYTKEELAGRSSALMYSFSCNTWSGVDLDFPMVHEVVLFFG